VVPAESAFRLQARSLADPELQRYLEANLGRQLTAWPATSWDLRMLSLAALYFHPAMEAARARLAEAEAAEITAGARPNPTLNIAPGVPSPYLLVMDFSVPVETAGKRGYRIASARSLSEAARLDPADTAWKVRSGVRAALVSYMLGARNIEALRAEEELRRERLRLLEKRLEVGLIARPELDTPRIELAKVHLAAAAAAGRLSEARAALAASVGVPVAGLEGIDFEWKEFETPPAAVSLSAQAVQREAVLNRLDVRRALAQYAAAEANLQLEVAKQRPDLQIGPGYTYEEGHSFFTVGLSATLPVFNHNQGPIAEAEARRQQAAAGFLQKQAQVIAESESSLARYNAALAELAEADGSLRTLQESELRRAQRAFEAGQEDRLTLNGVRIEHAIVARTRLEALARAQSALGALEDAVQRPLDPGDAFSPKGMPTPPRQEPRQ
jgi:outer membrane protein, heavy metal efflux system